MMFLRRRELLLLAPELNVARIRKDNPLKMGNKTEFRHIWMILQTCILLGYALCVLGVRALKISPWDG